MSPAFHDLSQARVQLPPEMSRGVDLALVRDKKKHQHKWAAIGRYAVTQEQIDDIVTQMDELMRRARAAQAAGETVTMQAIPIPLSQEQLFDVQGPGCVKCNIHFSDPEKGNGKLCEVNDDTVAEANAQQQALMAQQQAAAQQIAT